MNKFTDIEKAIDFVTNRKNINAGISNFLDVMNSLGNPQNDFKVIHVAGTNGKGSTVNFIKDVLINNGYKVGFYTSPHLIKHQDRIRINNEFISDEDFLYYLNKYIDIIEDRFLNMFEIDTLIMSFYFKENNIDFGLIEVGLGGRTDSTNIFESPLVCVITNIGYDHVERLGDTLDKIAYEKAEIIKPNTKVVVGNLQDIAMKVVYDKCEKVNAKIIHVKPHKVEDAHLFTYKNILYEIDNDAGYLIENACTALETLAVLNLNLDLNKIKTGIKNSHWPGRFERIKDNIILDGAHNLEGIIALIKSLKLCKKPHVVIFSVLKDKPFDKMVRKLYDNCDCLIVTEFDFDRVKKAKDVASNLDVLIIEDYKEAIKVGMEKSASGTLFVCGSLYFISEVRNYLLNEA
ncbi:MAG: bifunctional folylpolyglutamate synthase/dihydrofolate synthase [Erysipelotrichaceae bacterium]|nr:bifunctional folylpolyglutamate synthase/dihydrofolate synthase [Erysipelotrichaceae bacterium]